MFGIGAKRTSSQAQPGDGGALDELSTSLVQRLLQTGFDGKSKFHSAHQVAQSALAEVGGDAERAIDEVVTQHRKLAATNGFVTSVGGLVTMPVALPANVVGFYLLATRMTGAIAELRGYDIDKPEVRTAVLLIFVGTDANDVLAKAGVRTTGGVAGLATRKLPPTVLMMVNKGVGFRLVSRLGGKILARIGKSVPLAGGFIGAGLDLVLLNRIATGAREQFSPRPQVSSPAPPEITS